jgi:XTP/dITP diphosphohydrolase
VKRLLVATRSAGKLRELKPLFAAYGIDAIDLVAAGIPESPVEDELETAATFEDNALAKARYFHALSGEPTVADDSGLAVDALGGRPGVLSKRWSGRVDLTGQALDDENNRLLLEALERLEARDASETRGARDDARDRRARYVCAAAYVDGEREQVCRGEVHGRIVDVARGTGGFGYDPYFLSDELGRTFGEVSRGEKEAVSHRARAVRALVAALGVGVVGS